MALSQHILFVLNVIGTAPAPPSELNTPPKMSRTHLTLAVGLALGVGAALRLFALGSGPSLYVDEAMLALNIGTRSLSGLLRPLDYGQTAPIPFLWAERLVVAVAGMSEVSLRAIPFLAGIALPVALWRLARRVLTSDGAALATAFAALAPILIEFSRMLKPYTIDALVTVGLLLLALDVLEAPGARHWSRLVVGGVVGLLFSQPAAFVLAGVVGALVASPKVRSAPGAAAWGIAAAATWSGLFAALYFGFYRGPALGAYMQQYWSDSFLSLGDPELSHHLRLAARALLSSTFVGSRPSYAVVALLGALCGVGTFVLGRRLGLWAATLVTAPIAAVLAGAILHRYPIAPRVLLFAVPLLILVMAAGVSTLMERAGHPVARTVARGIVVAWLLLIAVSAASRPEFPPAVRPVVRELAQQRVAREAPVYVLATAQPMWAFYTTDWTAPDTARLRWFARVGSPEGPGFHNAFSRGHTVCNEGDDLVWRGGARHELIGIPTGIQARALIRLTQLEPDSGWAQNEVRRILAERTPDAWLFFVTTYRGERVQLLAALEAVGGERVYERETGGAWLYRYRLPTVSGRHMVSSGVGQGTGRCAVTLP
jgi:dolichyl-phosphate-mannose-protein mannosyltransferase